MPEIVFDFNKAAPNQLRVTSETNEVGVKAVFTTNASQWEPGEFVNGVVSFGPNENVFILHNAGTAQGSNQRYVTVQLDSPVALRLEGMRFRSHSNAFGCSPENPVVLAVEAATRDDFADATVLGTIPTFGGPLAEKYLPLDVRIPAGKISIRLRSTSPIPDGSNYIAYIDFGIAASPLQSPLIEPKRIWFDFNKATAHALQVASEPNDIQANAIFGTNALQWGPRDDGILFDGPNGAIFTVQCEPRPGPDERYVYIQLNASTALHLYGLRFLSLVGLADAPVTLAAEAAEQDNFTNARLVGTVCIYGGGPMAETLLPLDLRVPKGTSYIRVRSTSMTTWSYYIAYSNVSLAALPVSSSDIIITHPPIWEKGATVYPKYYPPSHSRPSSTVQVTGVFQTWTAEPFDAKRPWTGITLSTAGQYLTRTEVPVHASDPCLTTSPDPGQAAKILPLPLGSSRWLLPLVDDPNQVFTFWTGGSVTKFLPLQAADGVPYFQRFDIQGEVPGQHSLKRSRSMPSGRHIMSVTAAASASSLHLIATVMDGQESRALWHGVQTSGSTEVTWSEVVGDQEFPAAEAELVLHEDGTLSIFALDDYGWAHMRHADAAWSASRWNGQVVPFTDLTASYEDGVYAIYGLDDEGTLWRASFSSSVWGAWEKITIPIQPVFTDISSAAGYIVGTDSNGVIWVLSPQSKTWQAVPPPTGSTFSLVDMSWSIARRKPTLWAVDSLGALWSGEFAREVAPPAVMTAFGTPCPSPITGDFCAVEQGGDARVWGVSNLTELWGGRRADPLWDGPSWGGLRLEAGMPIFALAAFLNSVSHRETVAVSAVAGSQPSGCAIWTGDRDESVQPPSWDLWSTQPAPDSSVPIVALAAAHSSATRLWGLNETGALFFATLGANADLAWQSLATATVKRIAASHLPNGTEALWVVRDTGSVEQADNSNGFASFSAFSNIRAREIAVASAVTNNNRRTVALALDANAAPFDFAPQAGGTPNVRAPAFGFSAPPPKLFSVEMGTWTNDTLLRAFALDKDGWLWAASESSPNFWGSGWEGPRWKGQPARFRTIQVSGARLFAVDTAGKLWMFDAGAGIWEGPDWGDAASLSEWGTGALRHSPVTAMGVGDSRDFTSTRSSEWIPQTSKTKKRREHTFALDDHALTSVIRVTWDGPGSEGGFRLVSPTQMEYPNQDKEALYALKSKKTTWLPAYTIAVSYWKSLLLPVSADVSTQYGTYTVLTQILDDLVDIKVCRYGRTHVDVPPDYQVLSRTKELKFNPMLIFQSAESPEIRAENRTRLGKAIPMIKNFFSNLKINAVFPDTIPAWDYPDFPADFPDEPTRSLLATHGKDDAVNLICCSSFRIGIAQGAVGISGGLPAVNDPEGERLHFGIIVQLQSGDSTYKASARELMLNICHETGHHLGLTHESSGEVKGNLMRKTVADYGANLNPDQQFILKNAVLVTDKWTASLIPKIGLINLQIWTTERWGLFDGAGTDGTVSVSILDGGGTALYSTALDKKGHFSSGKHDVFDLTPRAPFEPDRARTLRISWEPPSSFFTDTWTLDGLDMQAYIGDAATGKRALSGIRSLGLNQKFTDSNRTYDLVIEHLG